MNTSVGAVLGDNYEVDAVSAQVMEVATEKVKAAASCVARAVSREVAEAVAAQAAMTEQEAALGALCIAQPSVRRASIEDVPALLSIYNHEIVNGVSTLDLTPKTLEQWTEWYEAHQTNVHPLFVAEVDGKVAGYTCFSPYRRKEAYLSTVELSVYVDPAMRGRGLANCLLDAILAYAKEEPAIHMVVSVITGGNAASMRLHEKYGFSKCGVVHEVGYKLGKYHDIVTYELRV